MFIRWNPNLISIFATENENFHILIYMSNNYLQLPTSSSYQQILRFTWKCKVKLIRNKQSQVKITEAYGAYMLTKPGGHE